MCRLLFTVLLLSVASAKDKPAKSYAEHGVVIAMRIERVSRSTGVYTDSNGKTWGGAVSSHRLPIYKIRAAGMDYELEGRRGDLAIGDQLSFRVEKDRVYVQRGEKERRLILVGQESHQP